MTYAEAVARVLALRGGERAGMRFGLDRIEALLEALGHPERGFQIIQVGGTNGKGSTSALLATMLKAAGRRVGLYTSPHLCSFRERIRVGGEPITEADLADAVDALATLFARLDVTMFEAATALALDHFAHERVDTAVLEVGLGGRLDATTVGEPAATVVTRIDYDHQEYLGTTLAEIASEKAAIIRRGFAVSAGQPPAAAAVVRERARAAGVPLLTEGVELSATVLAQGLDGQRLRLAGPGFRLDDAHVAMLGRFQASNALLATAAAHRLGVSEAAIRTGLERTLWPGRFQVVDGEPRLVLDGAHNPNGARALADALVDYFDREPKTLVVGLLRDKDAAGILGPLRPLASRLILTRSSNPRAADPHDLLPHAGGSGATVEIAATAEEALGRVASSSLVCVAGSLSLVGDVLTLLAGRPDVPCRMERVATRTGLGA
jgi:dihydrofolate synthase / folylpolyglutamate synthase